MLSDAQRDEWYRRMIQGEGRRSMRRLAFVLNIFGFASSVSAITLAVLGMWPYALTCVALLFACGAQAGVARLHDQMGWLAGHIERGEHHDPL